MLLFTDILRLISSWRNFLNISFFALGFFLSFRRIFLSPFHTIPGLFCQNISSPSISHTALLIIRFVCKILFITSSLDIFSLTLIYLPFKYSSKVGIIFESFWTFPLRPEKKGTFLRFLVKGLVVSDLVPG